MAVFTSTENTSKRQTLNRDKLALRPNAREKNRPFAVKKNHRALHDGAKFEGEGQPFPNLVSWK